MTETSEEFVDYVMDMLESIHNLSSGRFFGGIGLKADAIQFAMLMGDSLYFVVDDTTREKYEARGMGCFWYTARNKRVNVEKYYEVPPDFLEDNETLLDWAKESIRIARTLKK